MEYIRIFINETGYFYYEMAIYLVFGFLVAGVLHVFFPDSIVRKHLGKPGILSMIKSTLFGIPLSLCSCGVVPVATSLRRSGASKGDQRGDQPVSKHRAPRPRGEDLSGDQRADAAAGVGSKVEETGHWADLALCAKAERK